jgi:hypothetical protein
VSAPVQLPSAHSVAKLPDTQWELRCLRQYRLMDIVGLQQWHCHRPNDLNNREPT